MPATTQQSGYASVAKPRYAHIPNQSDKNNEMMRSRSTISKYTNSGYNKVSLRQSSTVKNQHF